MNVYFVYKVLTNRIRALIIAAGYIPGLVHHVISSAIRILTSQITMFAVLPSTCTMELEVETSQARTIDYSSKV